MQAENKDYQVEVLRLTTEDGAPLVINSWMEADCSADIQHLAKTVFGAYWRSKEPNSDPTPISYEPPIPEAVRITNLATQELFRWTLRDELEARQKARET
jgi:hypothetical protein